MVVAREIRVVGDRGMAADMTVWDQLGYSAAAKVSTAQDRRTWAAKAGDFQMVLLDHRGRGER